MKSMQARSTGWIIHTAAQRWFPLAGGTLACLLYLALAWLVLEPRAVWSPDEGAKLLQLKSLQVVDGSFSLDIIYTSQGLDPDFDYALINPARDLLTVQNGALMLPRLPVFTLLSWPFYQLLGMTGLYCLPALAGGLIVGLTLALVQAPSRRLLAWALTALGSPVLIYATLFWEHTLAAAAGLAAAWLILEGTERSIPASKAAWWILTGGLLALGAYLRMETVLFGLAVIAAAGWVYPASWRGLVLALGIYLALLLPYPLLHQILFADQSLPLNARHLNLPLAYLGQARWSAVQDLLIGPYTDEAIDPGWIGGIWTAAAVATLGMSWLVGIWPRLRPWLWAGAVASLLPAAYFLLTPTPYRSAHGLLFTTPWALVGLVGMAARRQAAPPRERAISLALLLGLAGYALAMLVFRASSPHGGLEWGSRFALLFYPLLALAFAWQETGSKRMALLLGLFVILGVGFQLRGLASIREDKQANFALNQALAAAPEVQVLSDLWWLPLNAAPLYPHKAFYLATNADQMANWLALAGSLQLSPALLVTLDPGLPQAIGRSLDGYSLTVAEELAAGNIRLYRLSLSPP